MIAKIENNRVVKYPVNLSEEFPTTSFAYPIEQSALPEGYVFVADTPEPALLWSEKLEETEPFFSNGRWRKKFRKSNLSEEEQSQVAEAKWFEIRMKRSALLRDSDWTQLPDVELTEEEQAQWAAYRQSLRDLTAQPSPFVITWPEAP